MDDLRIVVERERDTLRTECLAQIESLGWRLQRIAKQTKEGRSINPSGELQGQCALLDNRLAALGTVEKVLKAAAES